MGLSGTTWDTNTPLTWANMNHMGHYAPLWDTNHADVSSTIMGGVYPGQRGN